ncbi:MAG: tetratricopeptide repeat protein, partial [Anaerolineales bacterium]
DDDESLPMQIGISTGPALLTVDGDTGEYTVSGTTTSLVQRLERVAPIGSILISHDTFRHVRGVFNIEPSDPLRIRGRKKRIPTYLARSVKPRAFRMGTRGVEGVETNMVGRRAELEMLKDSFYAAIEDHETQVITIVSEPGLGKSRLLYEFTNWAELEDATYWVLQARATPEMTQRPYALLRDMLSFRFEIQDNDSTALVREKMERGFLEMTGVDDEMNAHFIGQLIGFDFSDSPHLAGVLGDAQQFQKQALYYLEQFFVQITSQQPGELISTRHAPALASLEDIHWADESSLGAINHLVRQNSDLPIMIVCLARPELYERRPGWGSGQPFHTRLDLRPLSNRESRRLVKEILQKAENIPVELRDLLVERSEGNPFIMEELIKVLIEDRVIVKEGPAWRVELDRLSKVRVPPTLTGLLQVLLDSLFPSARILLQRAAVVGRIFWDTAIHALDAADDFHIDINASLDTLAKRELIYLREEAAFTGAREFIFGNQMLRDVIYESLLLRQRRAYHAQAAQWMIKASGARVDEYTAMIAEHYQLVGENIQAAGYLQRAGERALRISAFSESLAFFERALALLPLEKGEEARQVTLEVHLGEIRGYLGDYHAARQHLLMALRLARALDDKLGQSDSLYHLGRIALHTSGLSEARRYLDESLSLAREVGDPLAQARAHYGLGSVDWRQSGDFSAAKKNYLNCLELAREIGGHAQMLNALMGLGIAATRQGEYQEGHRYYEECRNLALMVGNQERLASVLLNMGELWRAEKNFT